MHRRVPPVEDHTNLVLTMLCSKVVSCKSCKRCELVRSAGHRTPVLVMSEGGVVTTLLKVCYVAFSVEVLLLDPIALLLMLYSHSARFLVV